MAKEIQFLEVMTRIKNLSRGGGIEIDLTRFGFKGHRMSVYQNYLGGGMLGKVCANDTIRAFDLPCTKKQNAKLDEIAERLKKYFHNISKTDTSWESQTYEENQKMPASAY